MDYEKARLALATLQKEKQAQLYRLQLAAQAKQQLVNKYNHKNIIP